MTTGSGYFTGADPAQISEAGSRDFADGSFAGSVQLGVNQQFGAIVAGVEADLTMLGINARNSSGNITYLTSPANTFAITSIVEADWVATLRPRFGYSTGDFLFYATGGLAVTKVKYRVDFTDTFAPQSASASVSKTKFGWALGGGAEFRLDDDWSIRGEYIYTKFDDIGASSTLATVATQGLAHKADLALHNIRIGVNKRF